MIRWRSLFAGALAALLLAVTPAAIGGTPDPDVRFFQVRVIGSGSLRADYGREGRVPGITDDSGVDGIEDAAWRWENLGVARAFGSERLITTAEVARAYKRLDASIVSWYVDGFGNYKETKLCNDLQGRTRFVTNDGRRPRAGSLGPGEFTGIAPTFEISGRRVSVEGIPMASNYYCFHGPQGHGTKYFVGARENQALLPRGGFDAGSNYFRTRFDRDPTFLDRSHNTSNPRSAHTFEGDARITLEITRISERRYERLRRKYNRRPDGNVLVYNDPDANVP